jgi:hypothetical protein
VAREFLGVSTALATRKMPRDLRDQFDRANRASSSILFNPSPSLVPSPTTPKPNPLPVPLPVSPLGAVKSSDEK